MFSIGRCIHLLYGLSCYRLHEDGIEIGNLAVSANGMVEPRIYSGSLQGVVEHGLKFNSPIEALDFLNYNEFRAVAGEL